MHFIEAGHRLQFNDDLVLDDQIHSLSTNLDAAITHPDGALGFEPKAMRLQLDAHGFAVNRLENSTPESSMDGNRAAERLCPAALSVICQRARKAH